MATSELQREVQARLKRLSADDLRIANAFLAFLETGSTKQDTETDEIVASFKQSWLQAQSGSLKPINRLKWAAADD